ncbi:hypothetical protein E2C01_034145 [Portunus trituberculatus]|uniref:Uncharacterized protein n=1 Tax=Portunus trituberculatus TaxID=210409 RepID=A0A5B7F683_PORTR|nr:hypothetical protein [Portunus trituberculatus]
MGMIRGLIEHYKKKTFPTSDTYDNEERHMQQNPVPHDPVYNRICEYLSENLRGRWSDLGRSLGLGNLVSELFRDPTVRKKDKVYQESSHRMRNFGTYASHTTCTNSNITGQAIFLAIASMGHAPWDSSLCGFVSRGPYLFLTAPT